MLKTNRSCSAFDVTVRSLCRLCGPLRSFKTSYDRRKIHIESELFGYLPGAFTGASKSGKPGIFELADTGTIFLDEVGEIPMQVQSKLLRVLESGELSRVGDGTNRSVNVRIIAATNRDLQSMVRENTFREDLYYRLNVIPLMLPSLRERPEDIPSLADFYLKEYNTKYQTDKEFSKACMESFVSYGWPGNVRELKNMIHRMVITTEGDVIEPVTVLGAESSCQGSRSPARESVMAWASETRACSDKSCLSPARRARKPNSQPSAAYRRPPVISSTLIKSWAVLAAADNTFFFDKGVGLLSF